MFNKNGPTIKELIKQSLSSTKKGYDLLATKFDNTPFRSNKKILQEITEHIKKYAPFNNALDVCTGTGAGIQAIQTIVQKKIMGIDWSEEMLKQAKKNTQNIKKPTVTLVKKNVYDLDYENKFDLITCFGAYGHIDKKNQQQFLDNINTALKPQGIFAFNITKQQPICTQRYIILKGFDIIMKLRNFLIKPEFIMYYLDFTKKQIKKLVKNNSKWTLLEIINLKNKGSGYNPSDCLVIMKKN